MDLDTAAKLQIELTAVVVYLRTVGAVYPIAPGQAIKTIERAIDFLSIATRKED